MNKKVLIIGGGILVIGVGAYLYFTKKDKKEALSSGSVTPTTSGATTPATTDNLPKGTIITPSSDGGITPLSVTIPSQTKPTIQNQEELDRIMDSIKKNMDIVNTRSLRISQNAKNESKRAIALLKNDLLKLGYEVKEGSNGIFLVKL
jgi:hypothetical protein